MSLDRVYEVQCTALDADTQASMAPAGQCTGDGELMLRTAKAVALWAIQETEPTTEELVAKCLADRMDGGNQLAAVRQALDELRLRNLRVLGEQGYKINPRLARWERERDDFLFSRQELSKQLQESLKQLMGDASSVEPQVGGPAFSLGGALLGWPLCQRAQLIDPRDDACLSLDLRCCLWMNGWRHLDPAVCRGPPLKKRLLWIAGNSDAVEDLAKDSIAPWRSSEYQPRRGRCQQQGAVAAR